MSNTQYDEAVRKFVLEDNGHFIAITSDNSFLKTLRASIFKYLALQEGCLEFYTGTTHALHAIKSARSRNRKVVVLAEREIEGQSNIEFIKYVKVDMPDLRFIVLTSEIERERLILLHEMGVDNFITKPISVNVLIEKIAFTIKPPSKMGQLIELGKKYLFKGEYEKALEISEKTLQLKPDSPGALMLKGDALKNLGRGGEAVAAFEQAMRGAHLYLEPIKKLADYYRETGEFENALKYMEKLDHLSPLNVERKVAIGDISLKMGDEDKARLIFDEAVKLSTRKALGMVCDLSRSIAEACMESAPHMAEKYLRRSLETKGDLLDASDVETFNSLGIALRKQGRWQDAASEYRKALKITPQDENLHYNMAMALAEGRDYLNSAQELDKALKLNEEFGQGSGRVLYNMGFIYLKAGKKEAARIQLERSAQSARPHPKAAELLAKLG